MPGAIGVTDPLLQAHFWQPQIASPAVRRRGFSPEPLTLTVPPPPLCPWNFGDSEFETSTEPLFPSTALHARLEEWEVKEMTAKKGDRDLVAQSSSGLGDGAGL